MERAHPTSVLMSAAENCRDGEPDVDVVACITSTTSPVCADTHCPIARNKERRTIRLRTAVLR